MSTQTQIRKMEMEITQGKATMSDRIVRFCKVFELAEYDQANLSFEGDYVETVVDYMERMAGLLKHWKAGRNKTPHVFFVDDRVRVGEWTGTVTEIDIPCSNCVDDGRRRYKVKLDVLSESYWYDAGSLKPILPPTTPAIRLVRDDIQRSRTSANLTEKDMPQENVRFVLREFDRFMENALMSGQEVHCNLHLGSYDEPGNDGCLRNRMDGSAVLTVIIDPLPPKHHSCPPEISPVTHSKTL